MDRRPDLSFTEAADTQAAGEDASPFEETSVEYLARWDRLVSMANWEKGRIICEWRQALIEAGAPRDRYTDEAWSRRAGGVSPEHAGRLRRVYQRFGQVHQQYAGLYWSHFQVASDWPEAEMWLEGAVQNGWSVARMRHQRWQSLGAPSQQKPRDEDVITAELDEDFAAAEEWPLPEVISDSLDVVQDARPVTQGKPGGPSPEADRSDDSWQSALPAARADHPWGGTLEPFRPFENFAPLPPDLNKAFEAFKTAILRHKRVGWRKISLGDLVIVLDALKQLALAPAEDSAARCSRKAAPLEGNRRDGRGRFPSCRLTGSNE